MWLKNRIGLHTLVSGAALILVVNWVPWKSVNGATMMDNGGYSIAVAIDDTIVQPENVEQYIQRLQVHASHSIIKLNTEN